MDTTRIGKQMEDLAKVLNIVCDRLTALEDAEKARVAKARANGETEALGAAVVRATDRRGENFGRNPVGEQLIQNLLDPAELRKATAAAKARKGRRS